MWGGLHVYFCGVHVYVWCVYVYVWRVWVARLFSRVIVGQGVMYVWFVCVALGLVWLCVRACEYEVYMVYVSLVRKSVGCTLMCNIFSVWLSYTNLYFFYVISHSFIIYCSFIMFLNYFICYVNFNNPRTCGRTIIVYWTCLPWWNKVVIIILTCPYLEWLLC